MTTSDPLENLTFEEAVAELETILQQLEGNSISLEETMQLYARGQALARRCNALLDDAELRLSNLADLPPGFTAE